MEIVINMDQKCSKCGAKGACENGLCLECAADRAIAKMRAVQGESPATDRQQANYEICPKCGGSGRVYMCAEDGDGIKCHKCSGSGKLS